MMSDVTQFTNEYDGIFAYIAEKQLGHHLVAPNYTKTELAMASQIWSHVFLDKLERNSRPKLFSTGSTASPYAARLSAIPWKGRNNKQS